MTKRQTFFIDLVNVIPDYAGPKIEMLKICQSPQSSTCPDSHHANFNCLIYNIFSTNRANGSNWLTQAVQNVAQKAESYLIKRWLSAFIFTPI